MRIGRLDIGLWRYKKKISWTPLFTYDLGLCGCHIVSISCISVTWFGDECLKYWKDKAKVKGKRRK